MDLSKYGLSKSTERKKGIKKQSGKKELSDQELLEKCNKNYDSLSYKEAVRCDDIIRKRREELSAKTDCYDYPHFGDVHETLKEYKEQRQCTRCHQWTGETRTVGKKFICTSCLQDMDKTKQCAICEHSSLYNNQGNIIVFCNIKNKIMEKGLYHKIKDCKDFRIFSNKTNFFNYVEEEKGLIRANKATEDYINSKLWKEGVTDKFKGRCYRNINFRVYVDDNNNVKSYDLIKERIIISRKFDDKLIKDLSQDIIKELNQN